MNSAIIKNWIKKYWIFGSVCLIIYLSFLFFGHYYTPILHSDHALNVLMATEYKWGLFYCWGQDRGGTLIPFLGFLLTKTFHLTPLLAVSISYYALLIAGFIGFGSQLKNKSLLVPFALAWFFPFQRFIEITSYPIGMSYCLLGFSLLFIKRIEFDKIWSFRNSVNIVVIQLIFLCSIWVSDLAFYSLLSILFVCSLIALRSASRFLTPWLLLFCLSLIIDFFIIKVLKSFATNINHQFLSFNSVTEIINGFGYVLKQNIQILFGLESLLCIGAWILFGFVLYTLVLIYKNRLFFLDKKYLLLNICTFDIVLVIAIIFLSKWVALNGYGRWYFISLYISFTLTIFLLVDHFSKNVKRFVILSSCLLLIVGMSNFTEVSKSKGDYVSRAKSIRELNQLGNIGLVGEYWHSLIYSIVNPKQIKSVENDSHITRNQDRINEVFDAQRIFLVGEDWLDSFPLNIIQHSVPLVKINAPFSIAGTTICQYEIVKERYLTTTDLSVTNGLLIDDHVLFNDPTKSYYYAVYGPYIVVPKGKYTIEIYASTDYGNEMIFDLYSNELEQTIFATTLDKLHYSKEKQCFEYSFNLSRTLRSTEFRILNTQNNTLVFNHYKLIKH